MFVFNQINYEQYALRAKSLLDHKNDIHECFQETRGKLRKQSAAGENLVVEKMSAPDISINSPDCTISLLESRRDWIASA